MKIKKILIIILSLVIMAAACLIAVKTLDAQEIYQPLLTEEKLDVIKAEDIGIVIKEKKIYTVEEEKEVISEEERENYINTEEDKEDIYFEEEEEEIICPEGMYEGYEEGVYFEPNYFDCELHEYCYMCENHEIESEYFWDEDINPRNGWVYSETCIICGHGTCKPVTKDKVQ